MGWLREFMGAREPKLPSYGELARRCLEHPSWPQDIQPQARSLASLYSKFDRGIEVEWLNERPEVQVVLANVLQLPAVALEAEIKKHVVAADQQLSRWRLRDVPRARPIDLREEPLPRLFPDAVTRPGLWRRVWWRNGLSHGSEFLGRWLRARSLAEFATCFTWAEVQNLSTTENSPLLVLYYGPTTEATALPLAGRPMCVVGGTAVPPGFDSCETLPFSAVEDPLLEWLLNLLPPEKPTVDEAKSWLARWTHEGIELDFDTATGLIGAAHHLGLSMAARIGMTDLAQQYLKRRLEQLESTGVREAKWLRLNGLDLPIGIAKNALRRADNATWNHPRTKSEWLELIPDEYQRGVDADWTRLSLQRAGTQLTVAELERALSEVPPGGFRVLNVLCDVQLLQEAADGKFALHPHWLTRFLEGAAYAGLLTEDAEDWGQVALTERHAMPLLNALERQFADGHFMALNACLDLEEVRSPAFVMAVELMVVAAGRVLLHGGELEAEQVAGLLELQSEFLVEGVAVFTVPYAAHSHLLPRPRMLCLAANPGLWGDWVAAIWALSEELERPPSTLPNDLNPWSLAPQVPPAAFEQIAETLTQLPAAHPRVPATYSLLGRVLQHFERARENHGGPSKPAGDEAPAAELFAVSRVLRGDGWNAWQQALGLPHGIESIKTLVAPEAWQYLAKTAWRSWLEKGADARGVDLFSGSSLRRQLFWPHLPDRVLQTLLDSRNPIVLGVPSECMKPEWVTMYLEHVPEDREQAVQYLEVIPADVITEEHFEVLFELLEEHCLTDRARAVFSQHQEAAHIRLITLLDQGRLTASSMWLGAVPLEARSSVLDHLRKQVQNHGPRYASFGLCRAWLWDLCTKRVPGWLDVYPLLEEFELRLRRVNRAFVSEPALNDDA